MNAMNAITATEATRLIPTRNGKKVNRRTVIRWIRKGVRGVRLEGWKDGELWLTTLDAIDAFRRSLTSTSLITDEPDKTPRIATGPAIEARAKAAMEVLNREYFSSKKSRTRQAANEATLPSVR